MEPFPTQILRVGGKSRTQFANGFHFLCVFAVGFRGTMLIGTTGVQDRNPTSSDHI